jgi:AraC-like DNA-binding protein
MPYIRNPSNVYESDGFECWHQATCVNYCVSNIQRDPHSPFSAKIACHGFGSFLLTDASSNSSGMTRLIRGPAEIQQDPRDHFMLFLVTEGEIAVIQDGREARACSGDFFVYDQKSPFMLEFHPQYRAIILTIPRALLESRIPNMRYLTACIVTGDSKLGALAGTIVRQLTGLDSKIKNNVVNCVGTSTLDLLSAALSTEASGRDMPHSEHRLLSKVKAYMLENVCDPQLDVVAISNAQNICRRTLNRVFVGDGTTPMKWLWQQRLNLSYQHLAEGRITSVTDAAFKFGFNDVSHFSRSFKLAFGKTPHTLINFQL